MRLLLPLDVITAWCKFFIENAPAGFCCGSVDSKVGTSCAWLSSLMNLDIKSRYLSFSEAFFVDSAYFLVPPITCLPLAPRFEAKPARLWNMGNFSSPM